MTIIKAENKVNCVNDFCKKNNIRPSECVAVGDGSTDIPVFKCCGKSIALNASDEVKRKASFSVDTDNLLDILDYINKYGCSGTSFIINYPIYWSDFPIGQVKSFSAASYTYVLHLHS